MGSQISFGIPVMTLIKRENVCSVKERGLTLGAKLCPKQTNKKIFQIKHGFLPPATDTIPCNTVFLPNRGYSTFRSQTGSDDPNSNTDNRDSFVVEFKNCNC